MKSKFTGKRQLPSPENWKQNIKEKKYKPERLADTEEEQRQQGEEGTIESGSLRPNLQLEIIALVCG